MLAQLDEDAGEEAMGLVDLRRAPSFGLERLLGVGPGRERVALDHRDLVAGPAEGERQRQPADTRRRTPRLRSRTVTRTAVW